MSSTDRVKSLVPQGYRLVRDSSSDDGYSVLDDKGEEKCVNDLKRVTLAPPRNLTMRAHPSLRGIRGASKPIKAWLSYYTNTTGAAHTAFSFHFDLRPNLDSSWSSWQDVFDEVKVLSAELLWNVVYSVAPTVAPAQQANAVCVYQPSDTTSLTSVNAGLQYETFQLLNLDFPGTLPDSSIQAVSKNGFMSLKARVPGGTQLSNVVTAESAGMWRPTTDAINYTWGGYQGYVADGGTSAVLRVEGFVRMLCEFRTRR